MKFASSLRWSLLTLLTLPAVASDTLLVEAEMFRDHGGWVLDQQFMDQMGSPYLLAHGLGKPVEDAVTSVELPAAGRYRVWVRTLDWVARWQAPGTPGRFQLVVNGQPLQATFGVEGAGWHWQDGGEIPLPAGDVQLRLHDLTGFEGRCDAVLLSSQPGFKPPADPSGAPEWRRGLLGLPENPVDAGTYDLVVVGGGIAGTCAAISAARLGLKTALVQDRPVLGGNNSSEVRVWLHGARNLEPWPRVGDIVAELEQSKRAHYGPSNTAELYEDERKLDIARAEPLLKLFLEHRANAVEMDGGRIASVIAQDIRGATRRRLKSRYVADCTGDGCVGFLAGADFDMTPKGRMGLCNLWHVKPTGLPQPFPRCPWALDLADKPFPGRGKAKPEPDRLGGWYWESGFDIDPFAEIEAVRDWNFRAMYGAWDAIRNVDRQLEDYELAWAAWIMGKRESRRLLGDVILNKEDVIANRQFEDACVPTGWKFDLHLPDPQYEKGFEGTAFISRAHFTSYKGPYWIPYRVLYSRNIANLFMAGRDVSVTHEALGTVRVMRTGGCMGEIVGMAAAVAVRHDVSNRGVYEKYLPELKDLMRKGVGRLPPENIRPDYGLGISSAPKPKVVPLTPPEWLAAAGDNLARQAVISVDELAKDRPEGLSRINDGTADVNDNAGRWLSSGGALPLEVVFTWNTPRKFNTVRLISGYNSAGAVTAPIAEWCVLVEKDGRWQAVTGAAVTGSGDIAKSVTFATQVSDRVKLRIDKCGKDSIARIWEVEIYDRPTD